jgi:threonine/homoserine/homoserine lactone efflux protein
MTLTVWLTFLAAALLISVSPGAGAVNSMSSGLRYGVRKSLPTIAGQQFGYGVQIVLVGYALLASQLFRFMTTPKRQRQMNRVFGSLFVTAAVALASFKRA